MKILHLISSGGMYGAEAVILNLSHALARQGDECVIASFGNASLQLHGRALNEGLASVLVPCDGQISLCTIHAIRDMVKHRAIDVVHAHGFKADLYAWAALRKRSVPLVSTCHTWYDNDFALRMYGALDRRVLRYFTRVTAVSAAVEKRLLDSGVKAGRIRRIRNGINMTPFAAAAEGREARAHTSNLNVGLVGRLAPEKGVDIFVEAAAVVAKSLPEVRFVVVGEGPERAHLEEQIGKLGLREAVTLAGHREAMIETYAGLDLLVSASRLEGMPIAMLEGMASSLPVVATAVGEVPSLVLPGETGLLVPPNDAPALAGAMLQVLGSASQRLAFGRNGRRRMEQEFSADRMAAEYTAVYREALQESA